MIGYAQSVNYFDFEPKLFLHLSYYCLLQGLAKLDSPSWEFPLPNFVPRFRTSQRYEEFFILIDYNRADTYSDEIHTFFHMTIWLPAIKFIPSQETLMTRNIEWLEWSNEAFEKAKRENKPILLDIYGVWCHWCHRMEESYEDPIVIEIINEKFIAIKVDTDKRPDINERYNQGGWPTTAFLTPDGMVIAGATYLPSAQLAMMLEQVYNYFQRSDLQFEIQKPSVEEGDVKSAASEVFDEALISFDTVHGGFGSEPKFPMTDAIELALLMHRQDNKAALRVATKTLDGMMGIFDPVEGGFYRYSVTREWDKPHYEKMLETNAQLI